MAKHLDVSLLRRSLGSRGPNHTVKSLYGHNDWAEDLDIINELGAHTGVRSYPFCLLCTPLANTRLVCQCPQVGSWFRVS